MACSYYGCDSIWHISLQLGWGCAWEPQESRILHSNQRLYQNCQWCSLDSTMIWPSKGWIASILTYSVLTSLSNTEWKEVSSNSWWHICSVCPAAGMDKQRCFLEFMVQRHVQKSELLRPRWQYWSKCRVWSWSGRERAKGLTGDRKLAPPNGKPSRFSLPDN